MMNMQEIAQGLGVKCEYCHAGQRMGQPRVRSAASGGPSCHRKSKIARRHDRDDARPQREDRRWPPESRPHEATRVTCITCHRGVAIPGQLSDIITKTALQKGPEAAVAQYRDLRNAILRRAELTISAKTRCLSSAQQMVRVKPEIRFRFCASIWSIIRSPSAATPRSRSPTRAV